MKKSRIAAIILALIIAFCMVGCSRSTGGTGSGSGSGTGGGTGVGGGTGTEPGVTTTPSGTVGDYTDHKVEGTLHKITVTPSTRVFTQNGTSEYKIAVGADANTRKAGDFIAKHVAAATRAQLPIVEESEATPNAKTIYLGCDGLFEEAGLSLPSDDIGDTGYYIKNKGDSYYIQARHTQAYQLAAIAFLREVLGYDMFSEDLVIYEKTGDTLPDIEVIERPDIDYRLNGEISTPSELYGMGFSERLIFMNVRDDSGVEGASQWHNSLNVLPPAFYEAEHPDWYVIAGGVKQLCYTAHGNYPEYRLMVEAAAQKIIATVDAEPDFDTINFGQSDGFQMCGCKHCLETGERYGALSATLLMFVDDVDDILQEHLAEKAEEEGTEKRTVHLTFFAYHATQKAPVKKNGYGDYSLYTADWNSRFDESYELPEDLRELKANENVGILVAPIETYHSHSFYEPVNEAHYDVVCGWSALTDYLCTWFYKSLFHDDYFYPINTFDVMVENYRLCRENGSHFMFYQGNLHNTNNPGFTLLKRYIESKAALNVNISTKEHVDKFFKYYYGSAGEEMRQFFDELQAHMVYLETAFSGEVTGSSYDSQVSKATHWPKRMLDGWMDLVEKAYEKVNKYDVGDATKHEAYIRHICAESLLPRWALLRSYEGYYSNQELVEMKKSFRDDCLNLGIAHQTEADEMDWSSWGV